MDTSQNVSEYQESKSEMTRFLKKIDESGGISEKSTDDEIFQYLKFCYLLNKPRKLGQSIKTAIVNHEHHSSVCNLLEIALRGSDAKYVEKIVKIAMENENLSRKVDLTLLRDDVEKRFRGGKPNNEQIERIARVLNGEEELGVRNLPVYEELFLRIQKMFRSKEWGAICDLLNAVIISDWNFDVCKFYLLVLSKSDKDLFFSKIGEVSSRISKPKNIEDLVDIMYTESLHRDVINLCNQNQETLTFRTNLIYSRSLRKMGLKSESESILGDSKTRLGEMILDPEADLDIVISSILDIGYSGDILSSERLLFELTKRRGLYQEIHERGMLNRFVELVSDTLDRQKKLRLPDALRISRRLISEKDYSTAFRLLEPFVDHRIGNSADLFDLFVRASVGSGKEQNIMNMIEENKNSMTLTTAERLVETLDSLKEYDLHSELIGTIPAEFLDSRKMIRSFFKVKNQFSAGMEVQDYLMKITSLKKSANVPYFISMLTNNHNVSEKSVLPLLISSRMSEEDKFRCILIVQEFGKNIDGMTETLEKILNSTTLDFSRKGVITLFEKASILAFNQGEFEIAASLVDSFSKNRESTRQMVVSRLRSLISIGDLEIAEEFLESNKEKLTDVQKLRFYLDLGRKDVVIQALKNEELHGRVLVEKKKIADVLFRLNMHEEYCEVYKDQISKGIFSLTELTRYFHSLCKLGEEERLQDEFSLIRRHYSWNPLSRAILAIVGYDFLLSDDYVDELEIAVSMAPNSVEVAKLICNSFLNLERIDLAHFFFSKTIHILQHDDEGLLISKRVGGGLRDLRIAPESINRNSLIETPIYSDVEVIRQILDITDRPKNKPVMGASKKRIAIQSHTLGIGGAERQVSLLLRLLSKRKIKSSSFSLVTNTIPNNDEREETYYPTIDGLGIEIYEYNKKENYYGKTEKNEKIDRLLGHISQLKKRRILSLISIFKHGKFDIIHTWQDWCNIYGGIAAICSGTMSVILSGRTMPPEMKSRLQRRSGRSYAESYRLLLSKSGVRMIHNSDCGSREYADWLGISQDEFSVIHNGVEDKKKVNRKRRLEGIRKDLGIPENSLIVGFVGRFNSDKRPWLFLSMAEKILCQGGSRELSGELEDWLKQNGDKNGILDNNIGLSRDSQKVHFIMLGDGAQLEKARGIVEGSDILRGRVHLVGFSPDVETFMEIFDCLVVTSKVEGLPNVIIEAQFSGVPVLTTNVGGSGECIIDGETGILEDDDSASKLSERLIGMLNDREFRKTAEKKSRRFASGKFGQVAWSKSMNSLYKEC